MPRALDVGSPWIPICALLAGGCSAVVLDLCLERFVGTHSSVWGIYAATAADLFADGVLVGTGSQVSASLALLLALGQVPADLPEGFSVSAVLRRAGKSRLQRILVGATFLLPCALGASLGYWSMRGQTNVVQVSVLTFTAGFLLVLAVEEMIPTAHEAHDGRLDGLSLVGGFALFTALTAYS